MDSPISYDTVFGIQCAHSSRLHILCQLRRWYHGDDKAYHVPICCVSCRSDADTLFSCLPVHYDTCKECITGCQLNGPSPVRRKRVCVRRMTEHVIPDRGVFSRMSFFVYYTGLMLKCTMWNRALMSFVLGRLCFTTLPHVECIRVQQDNLLTLTPILGCTVPHN